MSAGMMEASVQSGSGADFMSVPGRITYHAAATPERVALSGPDMELTFSELDARAARMAASLRALGVGPDSCVAVLLPRSARYVLAALAVFKAGAAYLPVDPATPTGRVEYILGDAGVSVVLTDHGHAGGVPDGAWTVLDLDDADDAAAGSEPVTEPGPQDLAYVIYTSGSTGRPKGVEITHANLAHLVSWHVAAFSVTAADRASQVAGLGFDAAVWEVWPHLAAGASLHVADDATHRSPQLLRDWLVAEKITVAFAPTLLAEQLMHADWPQHTALRFLLTGADRLNRRPVPGQPFTVVNNYGPTECTVVSTSGVVAPQADDTSAGNTSAGSAEPAGPPSIGSALPGTVALVLDEQLRPVADGETGELVVAGGHVGRGYRHDPERTAARFVTVTAPDGSRVRAYRTGDRVRRSADGQFEFLGRIDDQIKVRGYRIEPAEIVTWLVACPGVDAAAVTALGEGDEKELVAHVVPTGEQAPPAEDVRAFVAAQLPEYMVPAHVMSLSALPTTPNGKLDTAALPRPVPAQPVAEPAVESTEASAAGARAEIEAWLGELVAELLKVPEVGVDDNIFLIGGHSMLAMQVVSRVRGRYGIELSLRQLFRGPTVSAIAGEVEARQQVNA